MYIADFQIGELSEQNNVENHEPGFSQTSIKIQQNDWKQR